MPNTPRDIRAIRDQQALEISWTDDHESRYRFFDLRAACGCARCVDERTGVRILDINSIADDISVADMKLVGNYAAKISWTDGHDTGLYTWEHLRGLCRCAECQAAKAARENEARTNNDG